MTNPLLAEWTGPFGLPPFDAIEDADFGPALEAALAEDLAEVVGVADAAEPPTFVRGGHFLQDASGAEIAEHVVAFVERT